MREERDYVAEAVSRLGGSLKRKDTDPRGRMEQLRRRIAARASTPADEAESQRRGTKRTMGDVPGEEQRRGAPPQPGGRPMPAAGWDRGPGDSHGQQGPRLHDPRADDPGPGELGHRSRHHGRGPRTDEEPAVRPPRDGGGRGMAHPESPPPNLGSPSGSGSTSLFTVNDCSHDVGNSAGPSSGIGGHASPVAGPPRRRRSSPNLDSASGRPARRRGADRGHHDCARAAAYDIIGSDRHGGRAAAGEAEDALHLRDDADRQGRPPPPSTRAELVARLRTSRGFSPAMGACASRGSDAARTDGKPDTVDTQDVGDAGGQNVAEDSGAAQGIGRHQGRDAPRQPPQRRAKRGCIDNLHDEFVCAKSARGVKGDDGRGLDGEERRGNAASSSCSGVSHDSGRGDDGATGGLTSGATAAEVTTPNAVPSFVAAVVGAQRSEVFEVTSAAVPVRRRIVGKRRDPLHVQLGNDCNDVDALGTALREVREPLEPGRCCGLTGRPPE